jgi:uncharacterized protein with HEPN domain
MKKWDDTVYLKHILDAIARIEGYLSGVNQETFTKTPLLQDGVIRPECGISLSMIILE